MRSNVDARRLDQRVRFDAPAHERSTSGAILTSWSHVVTCAAAVDATPARERIAAGQQHQVDAVTCWVRADIVSRFGIVAQMRATWRGKVFEVKEVPNNGPRGRLVGIALQAGLSAEGA